MFDMVAQRFWFQANKQKMNHEKCLYQLGWIANLLEGVMKISKSITSLKFSKFTSMILCVFHVLIPIHVFESFVVVI